MEISNKKKISCEANEKTSNNNGRKYLQTAYPTKDKYLKYITNFKNSTVKIQPDRKMGKKKYEETVH